MAGHRSPTGRARPAVPARDRGAHRAPPAVGRRVQVVAAAATFGAVAAGSVTAFATGAPAAADPVPATTGAGPGPVLAADAGVLQPTRKLRALNSASPMLPVAHVVEDEAGGTVDEQVASVRKASRLAEQLAAVHAEQARVQGLIRAGGLDGWIAEALQVMGLPQHLAPGIKKIILAESGGNPRAINTWDSNAVRGTPSRGLMQTIPSTFRAYVHPELSSRPITDPVANITAGVRYMIDRYGVETLARGGRTNGNGGYLGY